MYLIVSYLRLMTKFTCDKWGEGKADSKAIPCWSGKPAASRSGSFHRGLVKHSVDQRSKIKSHSFLNRPTPLAWMLRLGFSFVRLHFEVSHGCLIRKFKIKFRKNKSVSH